MAEKSPATIQSESSKKVRLPTKRIATFLLLLLAAGSVWLVAGNWFDSDPPRAMTQPDARASGRHEAPTGRDSRRARLDKARARLFVKGSLQGTEPAGNWCIDTSRTDALKPCSALRERFEYYLLGLGGEITIDEARGLIEQDSLSDNGEALTRQIMTLWDQYWQLRNYAWSNHLEMTNRGTWMPMLEEMRMVRRQILGEEWATAFFGEDEEYFRNYYAQLEGGKTAPRDPGAPVPQLGAGKDPAAVNAERAALYGAPAAERLARVDADWADWENRLTAARAEWDRLQKSAELSELQRKAEMNRYVAAHFNSSERLRIEALLHL